MRTKLGKPAPASKSSRVSMREIVVACLLFIGLVILGYGYFQHMKIVFYIGLAVTLAGVLNGVVQIVSRESN